MRFPVLIALLSAVLAIMLSVASADAQVMGRPLSPYEDESLRKALDAVEGELDLNAEGKLIEDVEVVPLEVFEQRDPAPGFLNWFHTTTQAAVINREVLMRVGGPFTRRLADETERNLRSFPQLSVVLVAPMKGSAPDRVRLLVVVKDVWSLRLNWEPEFVNGTLTYLQLLPQESNVLGTANTVFGNATFTPQNVTVGGGVTFPRVAGSRIRASLAGNAVLRCGGPHSGEAEGTSGFFSYGQPLYSTLTQWAWLTQLSWSKGVRRPSAQQLGAAICTGADSPPRTYTPTGESIPDEYDAESLSGVIDITRSFGRVFKTNLRFGVEASQTIYSTSFEGVSAEAEAAYRAQVVPSNDQRISPYIDLSSFEANFQRLINVDTLGLQEDFRIGHYAGLRLYPAAKALGSSRDMLGLVGVASYHLPISDGYLYSYLRSFIELSDYDPSPVGADGKPVNDRRHGEASGGFRVVTPSLGFGRFVHGGLFTARYLNNFHRSFSTIGTSCAGPGIGDRLLDGRTVFDHCDRIRGYRSASIGGSNFVVYNMEFRTPPVQIYSVMLGMAMFYDVGDAFSDASLIDLKSGAGAGLRLGFPQLNYSVFRVDAAFPLGNDDQPQRYSYRCEAGICSRLPTLRGELTILASFGQAF